jgi:hypothetical protein
MDPTMTITREHSTNSLFLSLEALGTLHFAHAGAFTLWLAADFHSDKWDWEGNDRNQVNQRLDSMMMMVEDFGRQGVARIRLGGSLEFIINDRWNTFFIFEGIVAGGGRRILGDLFGLGKRDVQTYGRVGFTYKFGM